MRWLIDGMPYRAGVAIVIGEKKSWRTGKRKECGVVCEVVKTGACRIFSLVEAQGANQELEAIRAGNVQL